MELSVTNKEKALEVNHNKLEHKFIVKVQDFTAYVLYSIKEGTLTITSTYVPKPLEGQGIASALTKACYNYAIKEDLAITATCSYAVAWLKRNKSN
ncbi:MAG: GNAT family N-acetyltransferase [Rikenellaceae bacterium]